MDHYGSFDALRDAFHTFVSNIPFYGFAALCIDHPEVQSLIARVQDRRIITYGFSPQADVRGVDFTAAIDGVRFGAVIRDRKSGAHRTVDELFLPMHGQHNAQNALAALAVASGMGIDDALVSKGFAEFGGVKRRFTKTGEVDGITIIDDYGHHPVEIAAVLKAARSVASGHVIAVVQPHRYSRLNSLFQDFCGCFNDADTVIVADVHAAGEAPIEGINRDALVDGLRAYGHRNVVPLGDADHLAQLIDEMARPGDFVICVGAGSITQWANALPANLATLRGKASGGEP
jgi:UDP-N-acetylmuramate--alanine ligase